VGERALVVPIELAKKYCDYRFRHITFREYKVPQQLYSNKFTFEGHQSVQVLCISVG